MKKRDENILAAGVFFAFIAHLFAYFTWSFFTKINIYYVTVYFSMFVNGFAFMAIARTKLFKFVSNMMFFLGSYFLYMEFKRDPSDWSYYDVGAFVLLGATSLLMSYIIEKVKNKQNG